MIYPELKNYLIQTSDPDTVELFDEAIDIFNKFEIEEYMDNFDYIFNVTVNASDTDIVDSLNLKLKELTTKLLNMHGIYLNNDTSQSFINKLCLGLYTLANYEDKEAIILLLDRQQSPQETFSELIELVINVNADVCLSNIDNVNDAFITNFKGLFTDLEAGRIIMASDVARQHQDYAKLKLKLSNIPLWIDKFIHHDEAVALPFFTYLSIYLIDKNDLLASELTPEVIKSIATDMLSIACISEESVSKTLESVRKYSDHIFSEINSITKLDIAVNQLTMEFNKNG